MLNHLATQDPISQYLAEYFHTNVYERYWSVIILFDGVFRNWTTFFTPYSSINPKWIKNLNVRSKVIKLLKENIGSGLSDIALRNIFMDMSPQAKESEAKTNY